MSRVITSTSSGVYTKSPVRGRIITQIGNETAARDPSNRPSEGVKPPTSSAAHNSIRSAPACSAARTSASVSQQTSRISRLRWGWACSVSSGTGVGRTNGWVTVEVMGLLESDIGCSPRECQARIPQTKRTGRSTRPARSLSAGCRSLSSMFSADGVVRACVAL